MFYSRASLPSRLRREKFVLFPVSTNLQHSYCVAPTCQLLELLYECCFNSFLTGDQ